MLGSGPVPTAAGGDLSRAEEGSLSRKAKSWFGSTTILRGARR